MLARLYREAPVNAIWEGSGNVMCLDVLRALSRDGEAAQQVIAELVEAGGDLPGVRDAVSRIVATLRAPEAKSHGRYMIEQLALLAACAALRRQAPSEIAESFAQSQFGARGLMYGSARILSGGHRP